MVGDSCANKNRNFLREELNNPCKRLGYSQGNQDCQLDNIFRHLGTTNKFYVEYGFNTMTQCSGSGPNTCKLWKEDGWTGLLLDGTNSNPEINLHSHFLYANNIVGILEKYSVPKQLDFLSGDMDSHDYFVMASILEHFKPRVVTTEYNQNWPLDFSITQIDPTVGTKSQPPSSFVFRQCVWGASASALKILLEKHGYQLVGVTPELDLIWASREELVCYDVPEFEEYIPMMRLGNRLHRPQENMDFIDVLADSSVWEETKDIEKAKEAARQKILQNINSPNRIPCLKSIK